LLAHFNFHPLILSLLGGDDIFPDELHHDNIADQQQKRNIFLPKTQLTDKIHCVAG
jgi:hypothetical protein